MGRLLEKIKARRAADSADLRKTSYEAISDCGKAAESCGFENTNRRNPQNPQTLRTLKPASNIAFHKSANPQGVTNDFQAMELVSAKKRLIQLAIEEGIYEHGLKLDERELSALVPPSNWNDTANCTSQELRAWGELLALRAVRYRGIVPKGWDQVAHCRNCGPVWCRMPGAWDLCPWCEQKRAGKWFPQPEEQP